MMKHRIILISCFLTFLWSSSPNFLGEVLHYSAGFRFFPAGHATLSIETDSLQDEMVYLLTSTVKTNAFISKFYKVRDIIKSWLSPENLSLKKTIQSIREGNHHRDNETNIIGDSLAVSKKHTIKLPGEVYDPIAYVYFLRMQKLLEGNQYHFFSYGETKMKEVVVNVTGKEIITVPAGTFKCFKIEPLSGDNKPLLRNKGTMRVWLSDDSLHLPVKIEQNTNIGTMVMKLKTISHSNP